MALNLRMPELADLKPKITVFGVGGAGGNAVNNMIEKKLEGADFVVANTDSQALQQSKADNKLQLGEHVTEGLGAGARPEVGSAAAEESIETIVDHLAGSHMCFITAGMGGGTGTGAAPIIAQAARELGILTVGVVTKPFQFEGAKRMRQAEAGVEALQRVVDTLIIIPNQNLFRLANEKTTFTEAFSMADDVLYQGVKGVTDLMVRPGVINLDFADVRSVMDEMGKAMMGTGEADGDERAVQAAEKAIANPLLDEISLNGAKGVLINITGGHDLTLFELDEAANRIREEVDPDANIIVGSTLDPDMEGLIRVSVVATGIDAADTKLETPLPRRSLKRPFEVLQESEEAKISVQSVHEVQEPAARAQSIQPEGVDFDLVDEMMQDMDAEETQATEALDEEGLPEPVYQPERAETVLSAERPAVANAPIRTGQPSPETLQRLQAAVNNSPSGEAPQNQVATAPEEKPSRFGINTLISRMTGHGEREAEQVTQRQQPTIRRDTTQSADDGNVDEEEQERIDIPAFLRRQAN